VVATAAVGPPPTVGTVGVDAGAGAAPRGPVGAAPAKPKARNDDPYDAAVPSLVKTVEAVVPPPPPLVTVTPIAPPPPATSVAPSKKILEDRPVF
jgi:hypothetical protein